MEPPKLRELPDVNCQEQNERLCSEVLKDLRVAGRSEFTITSYAWACKDFLDFTCGLDITKCTHREVREWLHYLRQRGSASQTIAQRKYALSSFFKFLERIGLMGSSPTRLVANYKVHRRLPRHHSVDEMNQLLAACDCIRDLAIISTLWSTGCRRAELLGMKIEDVNSAERTIRVIGKGDKERLVPLTPSAAQTLEKYIEMRTRGPVFLVKDIVQNGGASLQHGFWIGHWRENCRSEGTVTRVRRTKCLGSAKEIATRDESRKLLKGLLANLPAELLRCSSEEDIPPLGVRDLVRIIKQVCLRAGIDATHPHAFRHTFATHMLEGGADLMTVKEFLGHASIISTQVYAHTSARFMRETMMRCHPAWTTEGVANDQAK
jgi:integrase/recombinase XerC